MALTLVDLAVCCVNMPIAVLNMATNTLILPPKVCGSIAIFSAAYCAFSLTSVGLIAVDRYLLVCRPQLEKKVATWRNAYLALSCIVLISAITVVLRKSQLI